MGAPGEEAARLVGVEGVVYVGVHGLELAPEAERWREALRPFAGEDWPWLEDKGLTVAFHWREAPDEAEARRALEAVAERARAAGLEAHWGRKVLELRPPVEADKGTAVRALLAERGLERALYAGDDTTDLDAFRGLDGLELGGASRGRLPGRAGRAARGRRPGGRLARRAARAAADALGERQQRHARGDQAAPASRVGPTRSWRTTAAAAVAITTLDSRTAATAGALASRRASSTSR